MKNKILKFLKENILFIIILVVSYFIFSFPLPYYVEAPGGIIDISKRIEVKNNYKVKGSINMAYVSEGDANVFSYILAKLNKNYDLIKKEEVIASNETEKDSNIRGKLMLDEANDNAIIVAYKKANKTLKIKSTDIYITYIFEEAQNNFKVGDRIIEVEGKKVSTKTDINNIINNHNIGDKLNFVVINNDKKENRYATIINYDNIKMIGIGLSYKRNIDMNPKVKFNLKPNEYGSSGGLMMSLAIYNYLVKEDITKGLKIAGTGTIDENGNVGEIDGIKYKLKGCVNNKVDIFFVPYGDNYKDALKYKEKEKYDIKIIPVKTFDDVLDYLNK